jgi:short-subunit dehydrogenase
MQRTYLLLGAGPGIGLSTAYRFATRGFRIVLAARNSAALENMAQLIRRSHNVEVETVGARHHR